ncbi:hypothetical protein J2755_002173 [Methanohalophilus levihalophilus]|uniref:hypothetical protein n=1 Tax=Methanohalophilus levihalophilus TaxID=1431282 RepID=UPI001AE9A7BD|nr:hypothetical protein [Methanohalophilus levihalophilus]MBP2031210.1 hypothetical protein [Methanohalophilus levihalophilus]
MVDPNWLPSAIMQTVGALYGIFIAFFVLVLQSINKYEISGSYKISVKAFDEKIDSFKGLFLILTLIVFITEIYNASLVYFVSDGIYASFDYLLLYSVFSFTVSLLYILGFSYYLTSFLISLVKKTPDIHVENVSFFEKVNRYDFIAILIWMTIFVAIAILLVFLHEKQGFSYVQTLLVGILLLVVSYTIIKLMGKKKDE